MDLADPLGSCLMEAMAVHLFDQDGAMQAVWMLRYVLCVQV